jgi:hypothetical protein
MLTLAALLFTVQIGTYAPAQPTAPISVREEVRAVATEVVAQQGDPLPWHAAPKAEGVRRMAFPLMGPYRPAEWITHFATMLNIEDTTFAKAAVWIASWPVQVDASANRVYVRVTVRGP